MFLHAVEEGPATQSYGLQVAALAGVPKAVIRQAKKYLQMLEDASLTRGNQSDLFTTRAGEGNRAGRRSLARGAGEAQPRRALAARGARAPLPAEEAVIDIGANLTHASFRDDVAEVVARARQAGVESIVVTGTTVGESRHAAMLAEEHGLYATAGVHPHHARECDAQTIPALRELAKHPRVVAIGECGLDFNRNYSPHPDQEKWFVAQLELAIELGKPLFLHSRDAHPRFSEILRYLRVGKAVAHCFTGETDELRAYLDLGLYIGITGWICDERRGAHLLQLVQEIPQRPAAARDRLALPHAARPASRSPRRGATSRRSCRTSCAPWRARSAEPRGRARRRDDPQRPARSSACMNLVHLLLRSARWLPEQPAIARRRPARCARTGSWRSRVSRLASGLQSN